MRATGASIRLRELVVAGVGVLVLAQVVLSSDGTRRYLSELPKELRLREDGPQEYLLTTHYSSRDIYGQAMGSMRVTARYTRGLPGGFVCWNDVQIAKADDPNGLPPSGQVQAYMEGFRYKPSLAVMSPAFFKDFPPQPMEARVLVWDALSFEVWAWQYFEKLKLNEPYHPNPEGQSFDMAGAGSFRNQDLELTWVGVSKRNGETCALVQYESMFNPLDINVGPMTMKGRTHYWGTMWISLEDKQIEHGTLYEDGLTEMTFKESGEKTLVNVLREITFEKAAATERRPQR